MSLDEAIALLRSKLEAATRRPARVLIVEDSYPDLTLLLREISIGNFDCETQACCSPDVAVKIIKDWRPDVVLIDQVLPLLTGDEVIKEVRQLTSAEFVVVTGHSDAEVTSKSLRAGAMLVLQKPVTAETLKLFLRQKPHESDI